ncbi:hypothetical protein GCM10017774_29520 [Lentzea cavernae]|uniref:Uncharacterized protein n=1 Tax=Lentzea cavernae TaxID=2020703 RepID=A0ABQ3MFI3_9PSEU|nr:hypothetical protein GCM10017774_29520 [Lentzea cavernae]
MPVVGQVLRDAGAHHSGSDNSDVRHRYSSTALLMGEGIRVDRTACARAGHARSAVTTGPGLAVRDGGWGQRARPASASDGSAASRVPLGTTVADPAAVGSTQ